MTPHFGNDLSEPSNQPETVVPVVLYDGQCRFCCQQIDRLKWWDGGKRLEYLSLHEQAVAQRWPDIDLKRLHEEMCVVSPGGARHWGAEAVRYLSRTLPRLWWLAPLMHLPGIMFVARPTYAWVARNRYRLMGKTEKCVDGTCIIHRD